MKSDSVVSQTLAEQMIGNGLQGRLRELDQSADQVGPWFIPVVSVRRRPDSVVEQVIAFFTACQLCISQSLAGSGGAYLLVDNGRRILIFGADYHLRPPPVYRMQRIWISIACLLLIRTPQDKSFKKSEHRLAACRPDIKWPWISAAHRWIYPRLKRPGRGHDLRRCLERRRNWKRMPMSAPRMSVLSSVACMPLAPEPLGLAAVVHATRLALPRRARPLVTIRSTTRMVFLKD